MYGSSREEKIDFVGGLGLGVQGTGDIRCGRWIGGIEYWENHLKWGAFGGSVETTTMGMPRNICG